MNYLEKNKDIIKEYYRNVPEVSNIQLDDKNHIRVSMDLQVQDLDQEIKTKQRQHYLLDQELNILNQYTETISSDYIFSKTSKQKNIKVEYFEKEKDQFLRIINNNQIKIVKTTELFEVIYNNNYFKSIEFNEKENQFIFIAENKRKEIKFSKIKDYDDYLDQNEQEEFDKAVSHNFYPEIFIYDLEKDILNKIVLDSKFLPLECKFYKDEFYVIGLERTYFNSLHCFDRSKKLLKVVDLQYNQVFDLNEKKDKEDKQNKKDLENKKIYKKSKVEQLTKEFTLFNMIIEEDNIFMIGKQNQFYESNTCLQLFKYNITTNSIELLIDVVNDKNKDFSGLYSQYGNPQKMFYQKTDKEQNLIFETINLGREQIYKYNLETKKVTNVFENKTTNFTLIESKKDIIIYKQNNLNEQKFIIQKNNKKTILFDKFDNFNENFKKYLESLQSKKQVHFQNDNSECLLLQSKQKKPLICYLHGGPNSYTQMIPILSLRTLLLSQDYDILFPNYIGSISYGQKSIDLLINKASRVDVDDCISFIKKSEYEDINLMGFSHGGFLTAFISTYIKSNLNIIGNGVLYGPSIVSNSHIPEWAYSTLFCKDKEVQWPIGQENLKLFYESTPISRIQKSAGKYLVIIGEKDQTVSSDQGIYYHQCLKKLNIDSKLVRYINDRHSLCTPETQYHLCLRMMKFLKK